MKNFLFLLLGLFTFSSCIATSIPIDSVVYAENDVGTSFDFILTNEIESTTICLDVVAKYNKSFVTLLSYRALEYDVGWMLNKQLYFIPQLTQTIKHQDTRFLMPLPGQLLIRKL